MTGGISAETEVHADLNEAVLAYLSDLRERTDGANQVLDRLRRSHTARCGASEDGARPSDEFARLPCQIIAARCAGCAADAVMDASLRPSADESSTNAIERETESPDEGRRVEFPLKRLPDGHAGSLLYAENEGEPGRLVGAYVLRFEHGTRRCRPCVSPCPSRWFCVWWR